MIKQQNTFFFSSTSSLLLLSSIFLIMMQHTIAKVPKVQLSLLSRSGSKAGATISLPTSSSSAAFGFMMKNERRITVRSSISGNRKRRSFVKGQMTMWGEDDSNDYYGNSPTKKDRIPSTQSFGTSTGEKNTNRAVAVNVDDNGRKVRTGRSRRTNRDDDDFYNNINNNDDDWGGGGSSRRTRRSDNDGWGGTDDDGFSVGGSQNDGDYFEPYEYSKTASKNRRSGGGGRGSGGRGGWRDGERSRRGGGGRGRGRGRGGGRGRYEGGMDREPRMNRQKEQDEGNAQDRKINLRALEGAGFVHLYGLAPIINALKANKRDLKNVESIVDLDLLEGEDLEHELKQRDRKPEAQFAPWLFVQENMKYGSSGGKTGDKAAAAQEVEQLANQMDVPIAYVDKGVLNSLCGNRPHQGYVLRCGKLDFEPKSQIPHPNEYGSPSLWLCLDEVVDPQNFGALLRSAYFLGGGGGDNELDSSRGVGIMVCSKNSAPPSSAVSAASAGALELCEIYSTTNLPRTLNAAKENGWRVLGAAASAPSGMIDETTGELVKCQDLNQVDVGPSNPTILVLGSEGHGLRKLVARACSGFVKIPSNIAPSSGDSQAGVDSLNVSVTAGIFLWHFLSGKE